MKAQFHYMFTFVGLLHVLCSGSLVYGTETRDNDTNELRNNTSIRSSFCNDPVLGLVHADKNVWRNSEVPRNDDLDVFMINKTGCNYTALSYLREHNQVTTFEGGVYEWRWGMRAGEDVKLNVLTRKNDGYMFLIGEERNSVTKVGRWYGNEQIEEFSTPEILSLERYVWFHLTVELGRMTLQTECDGALNFTGPLRIQRGEKLDIGIRPWSRPGAKILDACPASVM